jgi:hypothetical protein
MELISSESPVFTNAIMNPGLQILIDDRRAPRLCFIVLVHVCPSPIKQMTPLTHIPFIHDTFLIHFDKLAMDFGKENAFHVQKLNH